MTSTDQITIREALEPGDLGRLITLHAKVYDNEPGHFGLRFEAHVAETVAEFVLKANADGRIFLAEQGGELVGCSAMVNRSTDDVLKGQLRWVLLAPAARGSGLGKILVEKAIGYAKSKGWSEVFLETTSGLEASMAIYQKLGFETISHTVEDLWDGEGDLIVMRLNLRGAN